MSETIAFLKEFVKHPTKVGAIAPSSPGLVDAMVDWFDWDEIRSVVEFGPGTGVFTSSIIRRCHQDAKFFAVERSAEMAEIARQRCPDATVFEDSATNLDQLCDQVGIDQIDAVICGLPWASFPESLQQEIMETMISRMRPGAKFATFAYWQGVVLPAGRRFSRRLRSSFQTVERSQTVWKNLPPAFVYRCTLPS